MPDGSKILEARFGRQRWFGFWAFESTGMVQLDPVKGGLATFCASILSIHTTKTSHTI